MTKLWQRPGAFWLPWGAFQRRTPNHNPMWVFLNGEFVPDDRAMISVFDRSFLYGDGLFETIRVYQGTPFRWIRHLNRLQAGSRLIQLEMPYSAAELEGFARELIVRNSLPESILRLHVS